MSATKQAKRAEWNLLLVCSPGRTPIPAGVILLDLGANKLHVRLRTDPFDLDEDTREVMTLLAEDLEQIATEKGGAAALSRFEQDWSHAFRLSSREPVTIQDPIQAVQRIFEEHVLQAPPAIQEALARKAPTFTHADLVFARKSLPFAPAVAIKAWSALRDPFASFEEIQAILATDPTIATHLVRLANSALHSSGKEVRSVSEALGRLGTDLAMLHVSALMIRKAYVSPQLRRVWNHSVEVAQIARALCNQMRIEREEGTLVALIHDIGRVALFGLREFQNCYSSLRKEGLYPIQIERELCGASHAEIGADLMQDWLFPDDMVAAVRNHHEPTRSTSDLERIVYLAESLSETNDEDVLDLSEHATALKNVGIRGTELLNISRQSSPDLNMLCLAAAA